MADSQWTLIEALLLLLQRNHDNPAIVFGNCIRVLTQLRTLSVTSMAHEKLFMHDWSDKVDIPPLVVEMVS